MTQWRVIQRFMSEERVGQGELLRAIDFVQIEKLIVVSFGSGDVFPIHGLTIPFRHIVRLTLSTCLVLNEH